MSQALRKTADGAAPAGATDERAAAEQVRQMFTDIAPRYDLLNHLLSCNVDRLWWRRTARTFAHILRRPQARVLDLCCGTGDMAQAMLRVREHAGAAGGGPGVNPITGVDFSAAMLERARAKSTGKPLRWVEADALHMPFADGSFDLVVSSFGFRNLANYQAGLDEILRVLAPGGEVGILDFGEPGGVFGRLYGFYFRRVLPKIGTLISGVRGPYSYLPESVERFPAPGEMRERMERAGFREVNWTPYTFGIAGLHRGTK
ncbi:MAG TPA: ubiquinone/menaquinone biosynthesis methyltransferase [Terriglobales bacterium]|nr:ubiquinone/menaquinone biosynthesis methyltransferase [Terriglobales bacterium]